MNRPDYKKIYQDLIRDKHPDKEERCSMILAKDTLSVLDVLRLNELLFKHTAKKNLSFNQQHKAYDIATIKQILNYQQEYQLNNTELATQFKLSRNTIMKWRKNFA